MQSKLQELTDKLYVEGLSKGKEEGEKILADAKAQAEKIIADAKSQAEKTVRKAEKDAESIKAKAESDVRMASEQSLQATKKDIENILGAAIINDAAQKTLKDKDIIKQIVIAVANGFSSEAQDLSVVLPETLKGELEAWTASELDKAVKGGIKAEFSKKINGGFTIGPADGRYFVSLTDETFKELICEYLRPVTRKLLFGE
ncbi:MAG: hypothetical protein MJY43_03750 [Bacteroidales bacterium]|nr:hypothetical protein [Bacteroidales bacterium]